MRYLQEDKDKQEKQFNEKWTTKLQEKEESLLKLEAKLKQAESTIKLREDENFKKTNEFEKLNALIEQKLQLTEKELTEYKAKYAAKDQDCKEINKELYNSRKEVQQLTNQLHRLESDKNDEIKQLKADFEIQLN